MKLFTAVGQSAPIVLSHYRNGLAICLLWGYDPDHPIARLTWNLKERPDYACCWIKIQTGPYDFNIPAALEAQGFGKLTGRMAEVQDLTIPEFKVNLEAFNVMPDRSE